MKVKTVHELRKSGWKVRVGHHRLVYRFDPKTGKKYRKFVLFKDWLNDNNGFFLSPKGGVTKLHATSPNGETNLFGLSYCLEGDYYNNKTGLKIALGRILKEIGNSKLNDVS
jgi:hypothetical protein